MSDSVAIEYYGLRCNDEGDFYVCEGADNEFIGCCTSDPCADGGGICPDGGLRTATFDIDKFDQIKKQSCDDSRASTVWYTCQGLDPPFMGCCDVSPCSEGCSRENLLPAVLSSKKANRNAFLDPESVYSTTIVSSSTAASTSSATSSASASATTSSSADSNDSGGLSHGAVAGIAAASAAVGVILIMLLLWKCWWLPRHRKQNGQQFHPVGSHSHMHHHHAGGPGEYDSTRSPTDYYQHSYSATTSANPYYASGMSTDEWDKLSPAEKASYNQSIAMGTLTPGQGYAHMATEPVHEMEGVYPTPQELSTGHDEQAIHYQHQTQSPMTDQISPHADTPSPRFQTPQMQPSPIQTPVTQTPQQNNVGLAS